jgi:hypothetical protein
MGGDIGNPGGSGDDVMWVQVDVNVGVQTAQWSAMYSDGVSSFNYSHTAMADLFVSSTEARWTKMIFGVANIGGDSGLDFITLRGLNPTGAVQSDWAIRAAGGGQWSQSGSTGTLSLAGSIATWNQPTDDDEGSALDNGGDDARGTWWCSTCENSTWR